MKPTDLKQLQNCWIKKENTELMSKQRPKRRYFHFDPVIGKISEKTAAKIFDKKYIVSHAFFPLLNDERKSRLYKRNSVLGKNMPITKSRSISYASHIDALIYSWYGYLLQSHYENLVNGSLIDKSVIAYRSIDKKSTIDFAKEVFDFVKEKGECVSIGLDIKGFYDNLDHKIVKRAWSFVLSEDALPEDHYKVFKSVTRYAFVDSEVFRDLFSDKQRLSPGFFSKIDVLKILRKENKITKYSHSYGIPQGTPISCILSNLYMYHFDFLVEEKVRNLNGLYRRYSDDIIVVCDKSAEREIIDFVNKEITDLRLQIQPAKTEIRYFSLKNDILNCNDVKGKASRLQYLGLEFDGKQVFLRHKGYAKYERNMTYAVRQEKKKAQRYEIPFRKKKIYERFSPLGKTTFLSYAKKVSELLNSPVIARQIRKAKIFKKIKNKIKPRDKK